MVFVICNSTLLSLHVNSMMFESLKLLICDAFSVLYSMLNGIFFFLLVSGLFSGDIKVGSLTVGFDLVKLSLLSLIGE